jgi:hypothetical protein
MTDTYRLFVELPNGAKFRAHGDADEVRTDLDRFYALLLSVPKPTPNTTTVNTNGNGTNHSAQELQDESGDAVADAEEPRRARAVLSEGLDSATLDRLFAKDRNGTVSLRALPHDGEKVDADALLALIYGATIIGKEPQVTGSRLMKAATQSGLHQVDRIDRSLSPHIGQYVTTAGFKKGRRYGLTNPGIRRAEEILTAILG